MSQLEKVHGTAPAPAPGGLCLLLFFAAWLMAAAPSPRRIAFSIAVPDGASSSPLGSGAGATSGASASPLGSGAGETRGGQAAEARDPFDDSLFHDPPSDSEEEGEEASQSAAALPEPPPALSADDDAQFHAYYKRDPHLLVHKLIYFLGMGANSAYFPFAVQWWTSPTVGLTVQQAGIVFATAHISTMLASPLLMRLADQSEGWRRGMLVASIVAQILLLLAMSQCRTFWGVLVVEVLQECASCAIWPSMDAATQRLLEVVQGTTAQYGNTRAFGALGWGTCAWIYGAIFDRYGMDVWWVLFASTFAPALLLALLVPMERRSASRVQSSALLLKIARWDVLVVLLVVLLTAVLLQIVDIYRFPFLFTLPGCSNQLLGISIAATAVSEAPFFFITSFILSRISVSWSLCIVLAGYAVRFVYYSLIQDPWLTIPAELLCVFFFLFCAWRGNAAA